MNKHLVLIFFILSVFYKVNGQSIGATAGGGLISGNSPNVSAYTTTIFLESPIIYNSVSLRLSFLYAADYNQVLPNTLAVYNPFIKGISLKALTTQEFSGNLYLDEGLGLLLLNDRIFSGTDFIDYGFVISLDAGFDLRNNSDSGFKFGAGTDFGFTFTNTYAKYFSIHLMGQYFL
jgi:hypothetical protein